MAPTSRTCEHGQVFDAPALTLTWGHAAIHQAIAGDRMLLPLDAPLSREVTGSEEALIHPNLVCDVAIGQSTVPTQRVLGNLFYRGLVLLRPVFRGDTLRTRTEVVALKQNRARADGSASGLAVLRIQTRNQDDEPVLDFYRCPMIPLRDPGVATGHADGFDEISKQLDPERVRAAIPSWDYAALRARVAFRADARAGDGPRDRGARDGHQRARAGAADAQRRDDAPRRRQRGRTGAASSTAARRSRSPPPHASRALPSLATIVAWRSCEHSAPVFEGDVLDTEVTVVSSSQLEDLDATLADLRAVVHADRGTGEPPEQVLDWAFVGVLA